MPKKVDANQKEVVKVFRQLGCSVQHLHMVGSGCPDIVVGYRGANYLIEIKDGDKSPSRRKLTPDEQEWHDEWKGHVCVVESLHDIQDFLTQIRR